ncbi:MAG TPA: DUF2333 family protein [Rhodospirillaceae bacterium]|nr:DUF2333 family protein [Rhodospirillaceae bacterium]
MAAWRALAEKLAGIGDAIADHIADSGIVARLTAGGAALAVILYFALFVHEYRIDDDRDLQPQADYVVEGGSKAVTMAASLMDLETNHWAPNKPWFYPIAHSTNMVAYQIGIQYAVAQWATQMTDFLGRERGSGEADRNLVAAKGLLNYDPTAFILPSAVSQYREGIRNLDEYNHRLAHGQAKYDRIASSLSDVLVKIGKDLGSQSGTIELTVLSPDNFSDAEKQHLTDNQRQVLASNGGYFDGRATEVFFATKGRMYAYYILLAAIGEDYHDVLKTKGALEHWENMLVSLRSGASLYKFFIANGAGGAYFVPSDLAYQGFFLLRFDKQLQELADILNR